MNREPLPDNDHDLADLVDVAQDELLASNSRITTEEVVQWIEREGGQTVSIQQVEAILAVHPSLTAAGLAPGPSGRLWMRGFNRGRPERNFIGSARR